MRAYHPHRYRNAALSVGGLQHTNVYTHPTPSAGQPQAFVYATDTLNQATGKVPAAMGTHGSTSSDNSNQLRDYRVHRSNNPLLTTYSTVDVKTVPQTYDWVTISSLTTAPATDVDSDGIPEASPSGGQAAAPGARLAYWFADQSGNVNRYVSVCTHSKRHHHDETIFFTCPTCPE